MTDEKQGRELLRQIASLIDLIKRGNKRMAKSSRVAAMAAQAQQETAERVARMEALMNKIAAKVGVSLDEDAAVAESSKPAETKAAPIRGKSSGG